MKLPNKNLVKNSLLHPIFILFIFNLIFFIKPILGGLYISPADSLQRFPSFNLGEFYSPKNSLLFDPVTQFQPWYKYSFVDGGNLLWNSLNAGGVPFHANNISALLFPVSFVFYILDIQIALIVFYFLKLFLIGLFTYLFLRELGIKKYPGLIGAIAFNFAGFNITWLLWPQTNVIIFLPLLFLLTEKLLNASWPLRKSFITLSLAIAFNIFAGHPETTLHIFILTSAYFIFRLVGKEFNRKQKTIKLKVFVTSFIVGILLSGILLIPFTEYLLNSYILNERVSSNEGILLPVYTIVYNFFPNLSGNPSTPFYRPLVVNSNYSELTGSYVGPTILFLSLLYVIFLAYKDRKYLFFILISISVIPLIYRIPVFSPFSELLARIIGNTRLLFVLAFSQAVLAAKFLNEIPKVKSLKKIFLISVVIIILGSILGFLGIDIFGPRFLSSFNPQKASEFIIYEKKQILFFAVTFVIGSYLVYAYSRDKKRYFLLILLAVLVFFQTGILNINYNPVIEKKYVYPETDDIKVLQKLPKGKYMELGGDHVIPADINLWYGLASVHNYDALDIRDYKELFNQSFPEKTSWDTILDADLEMLNLFGIRYVLSYTDIDKKVIFNQTEADQYKRGISEGQVFTQDFTADEDRLTAIRLLPANFNRLNTCNFKFKLTDVEKDLQVFTNSYQCWELSDKIFYQIDFPVVQESGNRLYQIEIILKNTDADNFISFWQDDRGNLVFNSIYDRKVNENLKLIHKGRFRIYENLTAPEEFYFESEKEEKVNILESKSTYKRVKVEAYDDVLLKSTNTYYPGWKVYIDSEKGKIEKVNQAFQGVEIQKGKHFVEFVYQPVSLYLGLGVTLLGLLLLIKVEKKEGK